MFTRDISDNYYQLTLYPNEIVFTEHGNKYCIVRGIADHPAFDKVFEIIDEDIACHLHRLDEEKFFDPARDEDGLVQWYYMDGHLRQCATYHHNCYKFELIEELLFQVIERSDFDLSPFIV